MAFNGLIDLQPAAAVGAWRCNIMTEVIASEVKPCVTDLHPLYEGYRPEAIELQPQEGAVFPESL
jgi:hypothetical protein